MPAHDVGDATVTTGTLVPIETTTEIEVVAYEHDDTGAIVRTTTSRTRTVSTRV